jgi:hypothetical protein
VFDVSGRVVRELRDDASSDSRTVDWDGRDQHGIVVTNGVYFVVLTTEHRRDVRRVVVLR